MKKIYRLLIIAIVTFSFSGCSMAKPYYTEYSVYLSDSYDELPKNLSCKTLVIDAQYYDKDQISALKENNGRILSYLNIGSIENFRDYFKDYEDVILGQYAHWDEEYWVDVTDKTWQCFLVDNLATSLIDKGVDGFFIDNVDVYYNYPEESTFDGITTILKSLKSKNVPVYINGGDVYVTEYLEKYGTLDDILDGVNQESVFTSINWKDNTYTKSDVDTTHYYLDYLSSVVAAGKEVYLIEYASDDELAKEVKKSAKKLGYKVYISDSIELD